MASYMAPGAEITEEKLQEKGEKMLSYKYESNKTVIKEKVRYIPG